MNSTKRGRTLAEVMSPIEDETASPLPVRANTPEVDTLSPMDTAGPTVVPVNVLVVPEDRRRLRQLSLDSNLSLQKLGHEAWNLLLERRGLPPLKAVSANVPSGRSTRARSSG